MDLIQKMALSKFKLTAAEKDAIPADTYEFDFVARISGSLIKGEDTDKAPTCSIPLITTLALLIHRMGVTRTEAIKLLRDVMTEAIELDTDANAQFLEQCGVLEAQALVKKQVIDQLPRTPVKGALRGAPCVELVGLVEEVTNLETGEVQRRVTSG